MMDTGTLHFNDGSIYYEMHGNGPPLVFLHGFSLNLRMWDNEVRFFSPHYTVITYDLRGFGQSSLPTGPYSHADDLAALLAHLNIPEAILIGHSLGGEYAIDFSLQYPDSVQSLFLVNSSLGGYPNTINWHVYAKEYGINQARNNWLHHDIFKVSIAHEDVQQNLDSMIQKYSGWHWLHMDPVIKPSPPAVERISEIQKPTHIIIGELDVPYYHSIGQMLHTNIAKSDLQIIAKSGHLINLEQPDTFHRYLMQKLENQETQIKPNKILIDSDVVD